MNIRYLNGIFLAVFIVISLGSPALSQMGGPMKGGMEHVSGDGWSAPDMMRHGITMRHGAGMQGMGFMHSGAGLYGQYITFEVDNETGAITNYGIAEHEIFDSITVEGFNYGSMQVMGAMTRLVDSDGMTFIQVHDNPAGVINIISSKDYTVSFDLAEGVTATEEDNMVKIESSDVNVYIIYGAVDSFDVSIINDVVSIDAPRASSVVVRAIPINMPVMGQMHRMFAREIARNRAGAEVCLGLNGSMSVVNYSRQMHIQLESMTRDRIRLRVNSTDPAGKILAFNLDNTSLTLQDRDRLRIHYDGIPMQCVDDPDLVFNATEAACWISQQSRERAQIMMYIPEFSEHIIEIVVEPEEEATEVPATPAAEVPGFESVIAAVGLLSIVYIFRKKC